MASLFSIKIPIRTKDQVKKVIINALCGKIEKTLKITTLNPEIALRAFHDKYYRKIISSSFVVIDGFGIKLVAVLKRLSVGERITGVELTEFVLGQAAKKNKSVFVVIRKDGLSTKNEVEEKLLEKFSIENLVVKEIQTEKQSASYENNVDVLLVGLGAPFQETFINEFVAKNSGIKVAIGVGGTFDFFTEKQRRAPIIFRKAGLEWLWRLAFQLNRIKRSWNATIVFLIYAIFYLKK